MNVMYIAPRYHTNQIPIINGWINNGDKVLFLSQYKGGTEDYSTLKPVTLGYSKSFMLLIKLYCLANRKSTQEYMSSFGIHTKYGWFPVSKFLRVLNDFKPDVIILRERCIYNVLAYFLSSRRKIPCVLYHQNPLWDIPRKNTIKKKIVQIFSPKISYTPVLGLESENTVKVKNTFYLPFVIEPRMKPTQKVYFQNDVINILCIGKYEKRKNHIMLVTALKRSDAKNVKLTIIGECLTKSQQEYYDQIKEHLKSESMESIVTIKKNLTQDEIYKEYEGADLFVIPSTGEFASISQLEAMACSLGVICSDKNGTSCYVESGTNGYLFDDNNEESLVEVICKSLCDKEKIVEMGLKSYKLVLENHTFEQYRNKICEIISRSLE